MLPEIINDILNDIEMVIQDDEAGIDNKSAIEKISKLLLQIKSSDKYVLEKKINIERFSRVLFSSRKQLKHGGKPHIKLFIITECEDLRKHLYLNISASVG